METDTIQNQNDKRIVAYLKQHGPSRQFEVFENVGINPSTCQQRLIRLEAKKVVVVKREPKSKGGISLKAVYYLAADDKEKKSDVGTSQSIVGKPISEVKSDVK